VLIAPGYDLEQARARLEHQFGAERVLDVTAHIAGWTTPNPGRGVIALDREFNDEIPF